MKRLGEASGCGAGRGDGLPRRLYLAGPMSGHADHSFPLFHRVARDLRLRGFVVFNPAENPDGGMKRTRAFYMRLDIPALMGSEAVVVLPGWERSRGASLEVWMALDLDLPVYRYAESDGDVALAPLDGLELHSLPFVEAPIGARAVVAR